MVLLKKINTNVYHECGVVRFGFRK